MSDIRYDFSQVCGNESVKQLLEHQLLSGSVAHAYLIEGEHGSGKTEIARLLCQALCCQAKVRPCGRCESCRKIGESLTPDVITVQTLSDRKQMTVDQIRGVREEAYLSSTELPIKAFLFERADAMNQPAQNALLKLLEEPPLGVYFVLMTDRASALLPTVRSRTQILKTETLTPDVLSDCLIEAIPEAARLAAQDRDAFDSILRRSGGSIGKAKELLSVRKKLFDPDPLAVQWMELLTAGSHAAFQLFAATLCKERAHFTLLLDRLLAANRDLIARKKAPSTPCLFYRNTEMADLLSARMTLSSLLSLHDLLLAYTAYNESNINLSTAQLLLCEQAWLSKSR